MVCLKKEIEAMSESGIIPGEQISHLPNITSGHVIENTLCSSLCTTADDLGIERVVIKGVSDYAGDNKSDSDPWRLFCSLMVVSLVVHALSAFDVFQE